MNRANYTDDEDNNLALWLGAVQSAIRGRRGQAFLRDLLAVLDALPDQRLILHELERPAAEGGGVCALGAMLKDADLDPARYAPDDYGTLAHIFQIAPALVREIMWQNDAMGPSHETPEERFRRLRRWVERELGPSDPQPPTTP